MDMSKYNNQIAAAKPEEAEANEGPFHKDGRYTFAVQDSEKVHGDSVQDANSVWGKTMLKVTYLVCDGARKGKTFVETYGLEHPSDYYREKGLASLQCLYKAINLFPKNFDETHGRRFLASIKSKESDSDKYPWNTNIVKYEALPVAPSQSFQDGASKIADTFGGTIETPSGPHPKVKIPDENIPF